MEYTHSAEVP